MEIFNEVAFFCPLQSAILAFVCCLVNQNAHCLIHFELPGKQTKSTFCTKIISPQVLFSIFDLWHLTSGDPGDHISGCLPFDHPFHLNELRGCPPPRVNRGSAVSSVAVHQVPLPGLTASQTALRGVPLCFLLSFFSDLKVQLEIGELVRQCVDHWREGGGRHGVL